MILIFFLIKSLLFSEHCVATALMALPYAFERLNKVTPSNSNEKEKKTLYTEKTRGATNIRTSLKGKISMININKLE